MLDLEHIIGDYNLFLDRIFSHLKSVRIEVKEFDIDHICFRTETPERYEEVKKDLSKVGNLRSEELIKHRQIAIFELNPPLKFARRNILYLELPAPSDHKHYDEGLEHIEFLVSTPLEKFLHLYDWIQFNRSGLANIKHPTVSITFEDGLTAKFCTQSIISLS